MTLSTHAHAAKLIRADLKKAFPNIKFRVVSDSFSMGTSIDVYYVDGPKSREVEAVIKKYQYGEFNGYTDGYEYSNSRDDIPQVKFVCANRESSTPYLEDVLECAENY
jgi:hypothetical protein